ncbi:MAG TPA: PH domain-containing protein [Bauldia sp.]|jgi:uncharacterized membrane protein YdbT with pleckstrin-like domain
MSYLEKVLQPGEKILHRTTLTWVLYLPGVLLLVVAIVAFSLVSDMLPAQQRWAFVLLIVLGVPALFLIVRAWFERWITEIAVTNLRVILKRGFIRRHTIEMNMDKVESVDVDQSLIGRLFNYGDITVRGVGSGFEPLRMVDDPLRFRAQVSTR